MSWHDVAELSTGDFTYQSKDMGNGFFVTDNRNLVLYRSPFHDLTIVIGRWDGKDLDANDYRFIRYHHFYVKSMLLQIPETPNFSNISFP